MAGHFAEWVAGLGPAVANHLWQSTAFVAGAWLLTLALRRNQAKVRHAVWLVASVKFLVPFSLLIAAGNLLPHPKQAVVPVVYSAMDGLEEPFADMTPQFVAPAVHVPTMRERMEAELPAALGALWVVGAAVVLIVWAGRWRAVKRVLRSAEVVDAGREWEILRRLEGGAIELRLSAARMEPGIFGVWRPVLVWPRELSARLDDEHVEAIVAHELAHVRRRDNLTAALHMLVETVFWFHPLVWWMERQMVKEREQACDEAVVTMGGDAEAYAESLLKTCRFCIESPLVCVAGVTGADLKHRVVEIVTGRAVLRLSWPKKLLLAAAVACVVAAPIVLGQAKVAHRLMLAAVKAAPKPLRAATRSMLAEEATLGKGEMAEVPQAAIPAVNAAPSADDMSLGPEFEVATIRPANPNDGRRSFGSTVDASGRFLGSVVRLSSLVAYAYASDQSKVRVSGGPKWAESDMFDINAKVDAAYMGGWDKLSYRERVERVRPMLRTLLAQRFQLKLHVEMQPTPVYALVQGKGGAKLKEVSAPEAVNQDPQATMRWMDENPSKPRPGVILCTAGVCTGTAVRMSEAINQIAGSAKADRMVVDATGLKGYYDFKMTQPQPNDQDAMVEVADDLGLKFEPRTMPVKTFVIDSAEKPSVDGAEVAPAAGDSPQPAAYVPTMTFDVASVRENKEADPSRGITMGGGFTQNTTHLRWTNLPIENIVSDAFGTQGWWRVVGLPKWTYPTVFIIEAKGDGDADAKMASLPPEEQRMEQEHMLQVLLAERFKLKTHWETKEGDIFNLVVAKGGSKLGAEGSMPPSAQEQKNFGDRPMPPLYYKNDGGGADLVGHACPIADLVARLTSLFGRPVIDETGLTGKYDFVVKYKYRWDSDRNADDTDPMLPLDSAIREQLGLQVEKAKGPVKALVIDHVEKPTEN